MDLSTTKEEDLLLAVYGNPEERFSQACSNLGTEFTVSNSPKNRTRRTGRANVSRNALIYLDGISRKPMDFGVRSEGLLVECSLL